MKLLLALVTVLSLAACKKDPPPTPPDNTGGSGEQPANDPYGCTVDADCVAVELECCDACNGGEAVSVNVDHVDEVTADSPRGRGECDDIACTMLGCAAWVTSCEAGKCTLARGEL